MAEWPLLTQLFGPHLQHSELVSVRDLHGILQMENYAELFVGLQMDLVCGGQVLFAVTDAE